MSTSKNGGSAKTSCTITTRTPAQTFKGDCGTVKVSIFTSKLMWVLAKELWAMLNNRSDLQWIFISSKILILILFILIQMSKKSVLPANRHKCIWPVGNLSWRPLIKKQENLSYITCYVSIFDGFLHNLNIKYL